MELKKNNDSGNYINAEELNISSNTTLTLNTNGKALTGDIELKLTSTNNGESSSGVTGDYVPITRTINEKQLNQNIILNSEDIGAVPIDVVQQLFECSSDNEFEQKVDNLLNIMTDRTAKFASFSFRYNPSGLYDGNKFAIIYKANDSYSLVTIFGYNSVTFKKAKTNGEWKNWTTDFLPLSGGTLTGGLKFNTGKPAISGDDKSISILARNVADSGDNQRMLRIGNTSYSSSVSGAIIFADTVNGSTTAYKIYGEHNKPSLKDLGITITNTDISEDSALQSGKIYIVYEE